MHALFTDFLTLIHQEVEQYRQLLGLLRSERKLIVSGDLRRLSDIVRKKEAVSQRLRQLAEGRTMFLQKFAELLGEPGEELTLSRVAHLAPQETGVALQSLLDEFRALVGRLVAANDVNRTLLQRSLEFVHGSLDLFRSVAGAGPTYGANGRIGTSTPVLAGINQTV
jgi:flagellar biosynthesis/type III secretory pathway chaperone